MDWGALLNGPGGGALIGLIIVLVNRAFDARQARARATAGTTATGVKSEAETARSFYANLLEQYNRMQARCDTLEQTNNILEAKLARAERARDLTDDLCSAHETYLDELTIAGNARFPGDWQPFLNNLRSARPPRRSGR